MIGKITRIITFIILIILISSFVSAWSWNSFINSLYNPKKTATHQVNQNPPISSPQTNTINYKSMYEEQVKINDKLQRENTRIMVEYSWTSVECNRLLYEEHTYYFYPTGCRNPQNKFTMCKSGCDYKYKCETTSMNPFIYCNAKLTLAECSDYTLGDIVLIKNKDGELKDKYKYDYLIHQIVDFKNNEFVTKGFNNNGIDKFTAKKDDIKGKVVQIEYG